MQEDMPKPVWLMWIGMELQEEEWRALPPMSGNGGRKNPGN
jgi:hypothetical protein